MGIALAEAAAQRGAKVTLILGPSSLQTQHPAIETFRVQTALEMYQYATELFPDSDIGIMAAAVSDYRPEQAASQKMKKQTGVPEIRLVENPDIAASLGANKKKDQILLGFALETNDAIANAQKKLVAKNLDLIVLNSLADPGAGFNHDTNKISIIDQDNNLREFKLKSKTEVAGDILQAIQELIDKKKENAQSI
jgi:phosphopantothenoylcysteine decarboxylase/phosphopantothenate--cysteine ligase